VQERMGDGSSRLMTSPGRTGCFERTIGGKKGGKDNIACW
jgi:hypothetical protein